MRVNYQYKDKQNVREKQLKRIDDAFDMMKRLEEIHGLKSILPCVFHALKKDQQEPVSKHVLLTFSGFLSQNDKSEDGWSKLNEMIEPHGMDVYDLKWQSIQYSDIVKSVSMKLGQIVATELFGLLVPATKAVRAAKVAFYVFKSKTYLYDGIALQVRDLFKKAIRNARLTGKLVALALVLGYPFSTQTVSLLGFSLGTQVIKSCLKTLTKLGASDLVHNVTLLGGASHYENHVDWWQTAYTISVAGKIKNCYSEGDFILHLYRVSQLHPRPVGREPLWKDDPANKHS